MNPSSVDGRNALLPLIKALLTLLGATVLCFIFSRALFELVKLPLVSAGIDSRTSLRPGSGANPLYTGLAFAFRCALLLTLPALFYFGVEAAITSQGMRKRKVGGSSMATVAFYFAGVWLAIQGLAPMILKSLADWASAQSVTVFYDLGDYLSLLAALSVVAGVACALPSGMATLSRLKMLSYPALRRTQPYAAIVITFVSVFTFVPRSFGQFALCCSPILLIYEAGIAVVWLLERRREIHGGD
jgi:Sec-independent protein secretion pathway component TatC